MKLAIEAKAKADFAKVRSALLTLTSEDRLLRVSFDQASDHVILKGMDERHLDTKITVLRQTYGLDLFIGAPEVAYLETMTRRVEEDHTHDARVGGDVQFARVRIAFEPNYTDGDRVFESKITGATLPREYVSGVESVMQAGILAGFPIVNVKATLVDGAIRDGASSARAFETAARTAFRKALGKGKALLLEPVMKVEVVTPRDFIGAVIGDLQSRRGRIQGEIDSANGRAVTSMVPLANLFGYPNQLRSLSRGRATFTMAFARYEPIPPRRDGHPPPAAAAALRA